MLHISCLGRRLNNCLACWLCISGLGGWLNISNFALLFIGRLGSGLYKSLGLGDGGITGRLIRSINHVFYWSLVITGGLIRCALNGVNNLRSHNAVLFLESYLFIGEFDFIDILCSVLWIDCGMGLVRSRILS